MNYDIDTITADSHVCGNEETLSGEFGREPAFRTVLFSKQYSNLVDMDKKIK
jgi:hypothetical protein